MKVALRESADAAEAAQALMRDFFETAAAEAVRETIETVQSLGMMFLVRFAGTPTGRGFRFLDFSRSALSPP